MTNIVFVVKNIIVLTCLAFLSSCASLYQNNRVDIKMNERIEWCNIWHVDANKDDLPRILFIGDSITKSYFQAVSQRLEGKAYCSYVCTSSCLGNPILTRQIKMALSQYKYDVIHFNNGLHGSDYNATQYRKGFEDTIKLLKKEKGAVVIWAKITPPNPDAEDYQNISDMVNERNAIADEIVAKHKIPVNDLYSLTEGKVEYYRDKVHYKSEAIEIQAKQTAEIISKYINEKGIDSIQESSYKGIEYKIISDVEYLGLGRKEKMDIYTPFQRTKKPLPAIIFIHGGGWATGSKASRRAKSICSAITQQGYAVFSIDYKLTEYEGEPWKSKKIKGAWPQNIYDCKTAVRYIRKNANRYNIDPKNVGVMGCSAGGHLALLTALSAHNKELNNGGLYTDYPCDVKCVVDMYGIPDVRVWGGNTFIDADKTEESDVWDLASPITHLSINAPPILIIHGDKDETVDIKQSINFVDTLKEKKLEYEFVLVKSGIHSFDLEPPGMDLRPAIFSFYEKYLSGVK